MKKVLLTGLLFTTCLLNAFSQNMADAQKAIEAEQYEKARHILEELVKTDSLNGENYFQLGTLYLTITEDGLAFQTFNKGLGLKKEGHLNYIGLGQYYLDEGKNAEAEASFAKATENIRKKDAEEWMYIARAYAKSLNPNYAKAAEYAKKAVSIKPKLAEAYLVLGDAEYNLSNASAAYVAYREAYNLDNSLLRAKLHLAVIIKNARAFVEAVSSMKELIASNPEYGPTYRELAETYYLWALLDKDKYDANITEALEYYKKYLSLTDQSLNSRMRHADFLVLAKDYQTLEKEALEMQKLDNVNPRILRYLGFSAFENGNYPEAIKALTDFIAKVDPKRVMGLDYMYLAKAYLKQSISEEGAILDTAGFVKMIAAIRQANAKDAVLDIDFSELGIKIYMRKVDTTRKISKDYYNASRIFEALMENPKSRLIDNLYYANSVLYTVAPLPEDQWPLHEAEMRKADSVYAVVIEKAPATQDAYFNRGRLNQYMGEEGKIKSATYYEQYIKILTEKGELETPKENIKIRVSEAYTCIGSACAATDQQKAIENFQKAIEYDPTNEHATQSLKFLKK